MTFNIGVGVVSTFENKIRFILRNPIHKREQYDATIKMLIGYLINEGFLMTANFAANYTYLNRKAVNMNDVKNLLSEEAVGWVIELYNGCGQRIIRENCPA